MFDDALRYVVEGVPLGAVYGLVAVGLVLTYKTSGVFNLAFGAQAFLSAILFNELRAGGWSILPSALVAVGIAAPLLGVILDRCLFRFLRGAAWQVKLITALGLLTGLPELVNLAFGDAGITNPPALVPYPNDVEHVFGEVIKAKDLIAMGATMTVIVLLLVMFRYTALGLQMRAVVESPRMLELAGVDSERVGMTAWAMSSFMAGLAGVLLAPLYGQINADSFTTLLVVAIAAAALGRLTSLPLAFAGGIGLGIAQQTLNGELDPSSPHEIVRVLYEGLAPALPFVLLFLVLILSPAIRNRREHTDPLRGVDPPPSNLAVTYHDARLRRINRIVFPTFIVVVILSTQTWVLRSNAMSPIWVSRFTDGIVLAVTLLSITVLTGLSGQISLAQASFSGVGGFAAAQLAANHGFATVPAMLAGAGLAAAIGALIAIPSLRLGGIYLTLATLAAALAADAVLFKLDSLTGGSEGVFMPTPSVFGIALDDDRSFFLFAFAVFGIVGLVVVLLRKGTTGRELAALRGSESAAPAIGINPTAARIKVFALSAGIAGLGGALYAVYFSGVLFGTLVEGEARFNPFFGFVLVVVLVSIGSRTVDGAVIAGLSFVLFPLLLEEMGFPPELSVIGFAFGAITYARHPEGIAEFQKLNSIRRQIHHRAVAARVAALEASVELPSKPLPTVVMLACAVPALVVMIGFAAVGQHLGPNQILVYGLALGVPVGAVGARAARELSGLARAAREHDVRVEFTWMSSVFPAFIVAVNIALQLRRGTVHTPTTLGWVLVLGVGTIVVLGWLGTVLWAVMEHRLHAAELGSASDSTATADTAPGTVAPVEEQPAPPDPTVTTESSASSRQA